MSDRLWAEAGLIGGVRGDGRAPTETRRFRVRRGASLQAAGSAHVQLGRTEVLVCVKAEVGTPEAHKPNCGRVVVAVQCSPVAAAGFRGRAGEEGSRELTQLLERTLCAGIDTASLCIVAGKHCWVVYVDALVLSSDGSLLDTLSLAAKAALADTKLPRVTVLEGQEASEDVDYDVDDDPAAATSLDASHVPLAVTAAQVGGQAAVDLTEGEEACCDCTLQVGVEPGGTSVCCVVKRGPGVLLPSAVLELLEAAQQAGLQRHHAIK